MKRVELLDVIVCSHLKTDASGPADLSPPEKELLTGAARTGTLHVESRKILADGAWLLTDDREEILSGYLSALKGLCERGLVRYEDGGLFVLTAEGFQQARELNT